MMTEIFFPKEGDLNAMGCAYNRWFSRVQARGIVSVVRFETMVKNWHWGVVKNG
jgi:hypothetical protein